MRRIFQKATSIHEDQIIPSSGLRKTVRGVLDQIVTLQLGHGVQAVGQKVLAQPAEILSSPVRNRGFQKGKA